MNHTRSQEVSRLQAEQKVQNCALLLAYVSGSPGGWYGIVKSSIDGFSSDYALISSNVGEWECHPAQVFCVTGDEDAREELEEIRQAVKESFEMDELPMVATLTEEEIQAAKQNVKEAWTEYSANLGSIDGLPVKIDGDEIEALKGGYLNGESVSRGDYLDREGGKEGARCYTLDEVQPLTEEDLAEWLEELCSKSSSDLSYCNWEAVAETVNE